MVKRNALGKGLSALLENADTDITSVKTHASPNSVAMIDISMVVANPFQPRTEFQETALNELAESIKVHGVIQPITVRKVGPDKFEIISGERRTRAGILAGLKEIPAYVRLANDQEMLEMALIENIQREDLNAIEVSLSYQRLLEECGLKQEELGERVGKKRSTVNNYLRLLKLPDAIQLAVRDGKISMGHARALITVEDPKLQSQMFNRTIEEGLSVRQVEAMVKSGESQEPSATATSKAKTLETNVYSDRIGNLVEQFGSKIELKTKKGDKGSLVIHYSSSDHLEAILDKLEDPS